MRKIVDASFRWHDKNISSGFPALASEAENDENRTTTTTLRHRERLLVRGDPVFLIAIVV